MVSTATIEPFLSSRVHHGTQKELLFIDSDKLSSRVHHGTQLTPFKRSIYVLSSRVHHGTPEGFF
ncbi:hypothetical protein [Photobacterium phosphoreum]|uniref:hypothetical protein n=1 Tax=Photobacterium phosphoreum TaxID=659 RepID=UPI003B984F51